MLLPVPATLSFLFSAYSASACTVCDSRNAHLLRAGLFNGHFLQTFSLVALPFPVFAILVLCIRFAIPDLPARDRS